MNQKMYLTRASVYVEASAHHPEASGHTEYSGHYLVIAEHPDQAAKKLISNLGNLTRYQGWAVADMKELSSGRDIPLEKRAEILEEVLPLIK